MHPINALSTFKYCIFKYFSTKDIYNFKILKPKNNTDVVYKNISLTLYKAIVKASSH